MELKNIKLVGVDLDGTLFNSEKIIDAGTRSAISKAKKRGIEIVPVTGRPLGGLSKEIFNTPEFDFAITNNGAEITNLKTGKAVFSKQTECQTSLKIIKAVEEAGLYYEVFANGYGRLTKKCFDFYINENKNEHIKKYIRESRKIVDDVYAYIESGNLKTDEILVSFRNEEEEKTVLNILSNVKDIQYWYLAGKFIEITNYGADKGKAFEFLTSYMGLKKENTLAAGDGENDISLLKSAGVSVAVSNAQKEILEMADIVTLSNDQGGIGKIIEKL